MPVLYVPAISSPSENPNNPNIARDLQLVGNINRNQNRTERSTTVGNFPNERPNNNVNLFEWLQYVASTQQDLAFGPIGIVGVITATTYDLTAAVNGRKITVFDSSSDAIAITLPAAADSVDTIFYVSLTGTALEDITIDPQSGEDLNGATDGTLTFSSADGFYRFYCDGTQWSQF